MWLSQTMLNVVYQAEMLTRRVVPPWLLEFRWQELWTMPLLPQPGRADDSAFEIMIVRDMSDSAVVEWLAQQINTELIRQRFDNEASVVLAVEKTNRLPAGVVWFCTEKYLDLDMNLTFQLEANEAWLFGAWVRRDLRGQGLYRELLQIVSAELRSSKIETIWLGTVRSNWRSRAIHKHLGAVPAGVCLGGKFLGIGNYGCRRKLPRRS